MAQLSCKNLTLGYEGDVLVRDLSFEVNKGDYLCIVGENGSGKSTLMKTILNLKSPMSGTITTGDGVTAREIGYLPQQTIVQRDFPASVWEIVLSGCQARGKFHPFYTKEEKRMARENIERMGITEYTDRCYRELSGGQQQRVLLARALCATRKILLLDEPVSGLDPKVTNDMYTLIEHLNKDEGVTIIMVSHDVQAAVRYATHILHVGSTIFFGTKEKYLQSREGRLFTASIESEENLTIKNPAQQDIRNESENIAAGNVSASRKEKNDRNSQEAKKGSYDGDMSSDKQRENEQPKAGGLQNESGDVMPKTGEEAGK